MPQASRIAVLPLGATEQHGPHLPPETDWIIAEAMAERLQSKVSAGIDLQVLPVEKVGYSIEHGDAPGTKTLRHDEAVKRWIAIGERLADEGCRRLVLLNAHGGNSPLMTVVTTELRVRRKMLAAATSWTRFGYPAEHVSPEEKAIGIHGGLIETSVMEFAIAPVWWEYASAAGVDCATLHEDAALRAKIQSGIDVLNAEFARVEQIKKFVITSRPFGIEEGELTPTLKVKRKVVNENFSELIEGMYAQRPPA